MKKRTLFLTLGLISLRGFAAESAPIAAVKNIPHPLLPTPSNWDDLRPHRQAATLKAAISNFKKPIPTEEPIILTSEERSKKAIALREEIAAQNEITSQGKNYNAIIRNLIIMCRDEAQKGKGRITNGGFCACCGIIESSTTFHASKILKEKPTIIVPPLEMAGYRLDKNPDEWLKAIQFHPDFSMWGIEERATAEKIVQIFSKIKESTQYPTVFAKALLTIYHYQWKCALSLGKMDKDKKLVFTPITK